MFLACSLFLSLLALAFLSASLTGRPSELFMICSLCPDSQLALSASVKAPMSLSLVTSAAEDEMPLPFLPLG